jgi:hypothetical protein
MTASIKRPPTFQYAMTASIKRPPTFRLAVTASVKKPPTYSFCSECKLYKNGFLSQLGNQVHPDSLFFELQEQQIKKGVHHFLLVDAMA